MRKIDVKIIDALLPQTQCGDCGYQGCMPYATAVQQGDSLDKCLPGGVDVLKKLGALTHENITHLIPDMQKKAKPKRLAFIREQDCIGCTKCIQACPVDAILGSAKQMHTVIAAECTGCTLCIAPCPVDCIELIATDDQNYYRDYARQRYQQHQQRLAQQHEIQQQKHQADIAVQKKAAIAAAIARVKQKKS